MKRDIIGIMMRIVKLCIVFDISMIIVLCIPDVCFASSKELEAKNAYMDFLAKNESHFTVTRDFDNLNEESYKKCSSFILVDLDKDNIPELVTFHILGYKDGVVYVYTFKNGKVKNVPIEEDGYLNSKYGVHVPTYTSSSGWWGLTLERCNSNHVHIYMNTGFGPIEKTIAIKKGKVVVLAYSRNSFMLNWVPECYINGEQVSAEEYNNYHSECKDRVGFVENNAFERKNFLPVEYKISYILNGGKNSSDNPASYKSTTPTFDLKDPTKTGYTFEGWYTDSELKKGKMTKIKKGSTGDINLYAKWKIVKYTIVFEKNYANPRPTTLPQEDKRIPSISCRYDEKVKLPDNIFSIDYYTFVEWNTKADGTGTGFADQESVKNLTKKNRDVVTLYAQWEVNTYTIKYDKNDDLTSGRGAVGSMKARKIQLDAKTLDPSILKIQLDVNEYAARGYIFTGWNTKKDGSGDSFKDHADMVIQPTSKKIIILYAQWRKSEIEEPEGRPVIIASPAGSKGGFSYTCYFNEHYFSDKNSEENAVNGLARLSACAALATYKKGQTKDFLKTCGFDIEEPFVTGESDKDHNDNATMYLGWTPLSDGSTLIAAIISGYTKGNYEWISNFDLGDEEIHRGFNEAADKLYAKLKKYLDEHHGKETKLWVTGHSRGGALSNLLAMKIIDQNKYHLDNSNVYTYGFATPRYTTDKDILYKYSSIINYVSPHDFVPFVAPEAWGYDRVGNNIEYEAKISDSMKQKHISYSGNMYIGYSVDEKNDLVSAFVQMGESQKAYGIKTQVAYAPLLPNATAYFTAEDYAKKGIGYACSAVSMEGVNNLLMYGNLNLKAAALNVRLIDGKMISKKLFGSHNMLVYLAWTDAWIDSHKEAIRGSERLFW